MSLEVRQTSGVTWEMKVRDLFRLSHGRTVFVGVTQAAPPFIFSSRCELVVDGAVIQSFEVSEELPERSAASPDYRAVGTDTDVGITDEAVRDQDVRLRGAKPG